MNEGRKLFFSMSVIYICFALYMTGFPAAYFPKTADTAPDVQAAEESSAALPTPMPPESTFEEDFAFPEKAAGEAGTGEYISVYNQNGIIETTISGGMTVKNQTDYSIDISSLTADGPGLMLSAEGPQILIFHTHSSEAYTQAGLDRYTPSDTNRTEDEQFNIIRVGDELTAIYEEAGLRVLHDREVYDYPSYTGSYTRSGADVEKILAQYPSISVVIDMHRDALGDEDAVYKTMAEESGTVSSQVMMLVGSDGSGLEHPNWRKNLALVLYLQQAVSAEHPTLMRPVNLVPQRYNQQLSEGMFILEVGSSGNTLQEALAAIRMYGRSTAAAFCEIVEK